MHILHWSCPSNISPFSLSYNKNRQVAKDEGEELAKQNHAAWVETSAKTNTNVGQSISDIVTKVRY